MPKKIKSDELYQAYTDTFLNTEHGKYVLHHIASLCGFWDVPSPVDPYVQSFANGQRNVIMQILQILEYSKKTGLDDLVKESKSYKYILEEDNDDREYDR